MNNQITLEEALKLVSFIKDGVGKWHVGTVHGDVWGRVDGNVCGSVDGSVGGTISGKKWALIEAPREKLARLIKEKGDQELIEAFNELEDSDG